MKDYSTKRQNIFPGKTIRKEWKAFLILLVGLLLTYRATTVTYWEVDLQAKTEFEDVCDEIKMKISARMQAHQLYLRAAAAFVESSDSVTRLDWKLFNLHANINKELPGIQLVGYIKLVPGNQLLQHIQNIRKEGFPEYSVKPSGERPFYTPVIYVEPFIGRDPDAFGHDMYSVEVIRKAMDMARDSNVATLSGKVDLKWGKDQGIQAGTLMFVPFYRKGAQINTVEARRSAIKGWVYSPYGMNDIMEGILGRWDFTEENRIHLQIFDDSISTKSMLYDSQLKDKVSHKKEPSRIVTLPVEYSGKKWILKFTRDEILITFYQNKILRVFFACLIISVLLFFLTRSLIKIQHKARKIADQLTKNLKESEEQLRFAHEYTAVGMCRVGLEGRFQWINNAFTKIMGYTADEILNEESAKITFPEDLNIEVVELKKILSGEGTSANFEKRFLHKTGKIVWASIVSTLIKSSGNAPFFITQITDITDKKIAENELRKLSLAVEQSPETIIITDTIGNIEYANPKTVEITGYTFEELKGKNPSVFKSGETSSSDYKELWETIKSGKQWSGIFHNRKKDGSLYWELARIAPIVDTNGKITNYLAIKEDITEKKRINDDLIASEAELKEANATKDKLFSIIAHDLRGPIGSFQPILELLTNEANLDEADRNALMDGLLKASKTTFSLLENLLNWARSQSNGIILSPNHIKISEIINKNVDLLAAAASQKAIRIEVQADDTLTAFADVDSINLVIRNLLSNAIKFTPNQGAISISAKDSGRQIEVAVEDNGVGIKKEVADHLFSLNSGIVSPGTNQEKGSGLGLVLCKDFVEKNGGVIRVESILGEGSRFTFTVPKG
ncbi:MAG: PAS domain S-box protein [Prolixibacteraceae bacterium]|jgi:PAS domain S-box-containing protein|nr:PAS domain S-box protein [Prolixibacteraceae bacterium]